MKDLLIVHERIKEYRVLMELTQQQVAEGANLSVSNYRSIEAGRSTTTKENIAKIAKVLGVKSEKLYRKNTVVIAVGMHKGGAGKTSVVTLLIGALIEMGYKLLVVDGDMQCNLTETFELPEAEDKNLLQVMVKDQAAKDNIIQTQHKNLDMLASHHEMADIEILLMNRSLQRELLFQRKILPIVTEGVYDFIIVDTGPTLGMMNTNILCASDYVIIPVVPAPYCVKGLPPFYRFIKTIQKVNTQLEIAGIIITNVDMRESISSTMIMMIKAAFIGTKIFETILPTDTKLKQAQDAKELLPSMYPSSRLSQASHEFAKEVLKVVKG